MKRLDIIIIAVVFIISIVSLGILKIYSNKNYDDMYVHISVDGKLIKTIPFDTESHGEEFKVKTKLGKNIIRIEDGMVKMVEADCPDKICVKDGPISKPGEILVCLPHKVVVEIKGYGKAEVDELSY
ncbi:NusG domain II-containing protein [Paramaledivibacter caminithermalis]|jgi:hypothetical protein|uniref:Uncharacterized protein n=1 Tax=Paramaledivibacter caminithermalis (strain DSM 15212 / CIP 107654 / DViRD3) TaxID=1121301 RepID=A0A1M6NQT6_PARC5|nr:NusG domain II-containing protein [Paramaledivibacter caminithermalis]SHJ98065.1 hypothetical protein SAMN02745912_01835 [Paramaledivibacter caminithermalis DSM 15212]